MRRYVVTAAIAGCIVIVLFMIAGRKASLRSVQPVTEVPVAMSKDVVKTASAGVPSARSSAWSPQIARSGKLSLFVGDPQAAANAIAAAAHHYGGQVFSLEFASGGSSAPESAQVEIRVPADRYDVTVAAIAAIGKVRDRSESAQDLTGDLADSSASLENLRRTESDMRKIMDRSGSVEQILDVENQLSTVRDQIQRLESELKTMHAQVIYSTIDVSLQTEAGALPVEAAPLSQLAGTWQNAVHALVETTLALAGALLWAAVFAPYAAAAAAIGLFLRRRRARA